jgi:polyisoprenyl-phosphate glycosyltransferase
MAGMVLAVLGAITVLVAKSRGNIAVPGYTATVLAIFFFGGLTSAGLGIVGEYLWMCLQNTRQRPLFIVESKTVKDEPTGPPDPRRPR